MEKGRDERRNGEREKIMNGKSNGKIEGEAGAEEGTNGTRKEKGI